MIEIRETTKPDAPAGVRVIEIEDDGTKIKLAIQTSANVQHIPDGGPEWSPSPRSNRELAERLAPLVCRLLSSPLARRL